MSLTSACTPLIEPTARDASAEVDGVKIDPAGEPEGGTGADTQDDSQQELDGGRLDGALKKPRPDAALNGPDGAIKRVDAGSRDASTSNAKKALGVACAGPTECESNSCLDGVCCGTPSCSTCSKCGAGGACLPVAGAEDADSCLGAQSCNPRAECKSKIGQVCSGVGETCVSGICEDGVCCPTRCPLCASCGVQPGVCKPVSGDGIGCASTSSCLNGACFAVEQPPSRATSTRELTSTSLIQAVSIRRAGSVSAVRVSMTCSSPGAVKLALYALGADPANDMLFDHIADANPGIVSVDALGTTYLQGSYVPPIRVEAGTRLAIGVVRVTEGRCTLRTNTGTIPPDTQLYELGAGTFVAQPDQLISQLLIAP